MNISGVVLLLLAVAGAILYGSAAINEFSEDSIEANATSLETIQTTDSVVGSLFGLIGYSPIILGAMGLIYCYNRL